jgi:hypothetical protein
MTDSTFRERFLESSDRFQAAMLAAIRAHQEGVLIFNETHTHLQESLDGLQESNDELKRLVLNQGFELRAQGVELRALREKRPPIGSFESSHARRPAAG